MTEKEEQFQLGGGELGGFLERKKKWNILSTLT